MAAKRSPRRRTASTEEGREAQMVSLATDLAERQLREGTASAQVINHYLKLGSSRERLEQERIATENLLLEARAEAMAAQGQVETLYREALEAFRGYSGQDPIRDDTVEEEDW